jgi:hypothetical protein
MAMIFIPAAWENVELRRQGSFWSTLYDPLSNLPPLELSELSPALRAAIRKMKAFIFLIAKAVKENNTFHHALMVKF